METDGDLQVISNEAQDEDRHGKCVTSGILVAEQVGQKSVIPF